MTLNQYLDEEKKDFKQNNIANYGNDTQPKKVCFLIKKIYNDSENTGIVEDRQKVSHNGNIEIIEPRLERVSELNQEEDLIKNDLPTDIKKEANRIFRQSLKAQEENENKDDKDYFTSPASRNKPENIIYLDEVDIPQNNRNFNNINNFNNNINNNENIESETEQLSCGKELNSPQFKTGSKKENKKSMSFYNLIRSHNKEGLDTQNVNENAVVYDNEIKLNIQYNYKNYADFSN